MTRTEPRLACRRLKRLGNQLRVTAVSLLVAIGSSASIGIAQEIKITASDATPGSLFGRSLAYSAGRLAVAAPASDWHNVDSPGSVYVFVESNGSWIEEVKLTTSDGEVEDYFGHSVAISGETIVVGGGNYGNPTYSPGLAYIYSRNGSVWSEVRLIPADGEAGDRFGKSVAISGDTIVVGSAGDDSYGSAYVFVRSGDNWIQEQKLTASDGAYPDSFGNSVAIEGDTIVVGNREDVYEGAPWWDEGFGSAYVFVRSGSTWTEESKLTASPPRREEFFGTSVAISDGTILVGTWYPSQAEGYVFSRTNTGWALEEKLNSTDGPSNLRAHMVATSGDSAVIGRWGEFSAGLALVFTRSNGGWVERPKLSVSDSAGDWFGYGVATSGRQVFVGAPLDDDLGERSGAVYVFSSGLEEADCFDGLDNDSDGLFDCADPDCDASMGPPCDTGELGICSAGTRTCSGGTEICLQDNDPLPEGPFGDPTCGDGLDNNCNGYADDDDPNCTGCDPTDSDGDGILDDGSCNGVPGDDPCRNGNTLDCDDNCPQTPNLNQVDADGDGIGKECEIDLAIQQVRLAQVVWDPDINVPPDGRTDLIIGRPAVAEVTVNVTGEPPIPGESVNIQLGSPPDVLKTLRVPLRDLWSNPTWTLPPIDIWTEGDFAITVTIDPGSPDGEIEESNETNNQYTPIGHTEDSIPVTGKTVRNLHLSYIPLLGRPPLFNSPFEFENTVDGSNNFISATYPINTESGFRVDKGQGILAEPFPLLGIIADCGKVWKRAYTTSGGQMDMAIGIVGGDYFAFQYWPLPPIRGIACRGVPAVLSEDEWWATVAHEVGHKHGLPSTPYTPGGEEEYHVDTDPSENYEGNLAEGFWVAQGQRIENKICFMGNAPGFQDLSFDFQWIDDEDFKHLFREFRTEPTDPEVLVITGNFIKNGALQVDSWLALPEGKTQGEFGGDWMVRFHDSVGSLIDEVSFETSFSIPHGHHGVIETDIAPFGFAVPYPAEATSIEFVDTEGEATRLDLSSKVLRDAVDLIPAECFDRSNSEASRRALQNKIDALQSLIESGELYEAVTKLHDDIEDKFHKWLLDDCVPEDPLQIDKAEILDLTQMIAERLENQF